MTDDESADILMSMSRSCGVQLRDDRIACLLPITLPTSKVRVKRNRHPIAVRQIAVRADDLIEWQVSYHESGDKSKPAELGIMLELATRQGMITSETLKALLSYVKKVPQFFSGCMQIDLVPAGQKFLDEYELFYSKVPVIRRLLDSGCFVEAALGHKQRAVGYQPMLFVFIPATNIVASEGRSSLVGRPAEPKEIVIWYPSQNDIVETTRMFSVLSSKHNVDMRRIISQVLKTSQ